jgi:tripartite-type tricarboxylate transporter receptor subunit TctC
VLPSFRAGIEARTARALGVAALARLAVLRDVPTLGEAAVQGVERTSCCGK